MTEQIKGSAGFVAGTLGVLAFTGAFTLSAQAGECFFGNDGNYPCTIERDADGGVTIDAGDYDQSAFVNTGDGQFERIVYDPSEGRGKIAGYYTIIADNPQCFRNTQFEDDVVCAYE